MRILIISFLGPFGNSARGLQITKVAKAINNSGCEVIFVSGKPDIESDSQNCDFKIVGIPYSQKMYSYDNIKENVNKYWARFLNVKYRQGWIKRATLATSNLIEEYKPDAFLTSATPMDSHIVGLRLKKKYNIPWIATFSDPWPPKILPIPYNEGNCHLSFYEMYLARNILKSCDVIHMPNSVAIDFVENMMKVKIKDKSWAIPHIGSEVTQSPVGFEPGWLVHTGFIGRERISIPLLEAVKETAELYPNNFKGMICIGSTCDEFKNIIKNLKLESVIKLKNQVSSEDAVKATLKAQALLVIEADMSLSPFLPSKYADYVMTGRPIIALTPSISPIRNYINMHQEGYAVHHDINEIKNALKKIFIESNHESENTINSENSLVSVFKAENVGKNYIEMIKSIIRTA